VEAFAITEGQLEDAIVSREDEDVSRGIEHCRADFAVFEVVLDVGARLDGKGVVQIAGDIVPDMAAV
jgi:hypothetical protein